MTVPWALLLFLLFPRYNSFLRQCWGPPVKTLQNTAAKLTSQSSEIELTGKKRSTQVVHVYTHTESYIPCFSFTITLSLLPLHKQTLKRRDSGHSFQPRLMNRGWPESVSHRSSAQHPQSSSLLMGLDEIDSPVREPYAHFWVSCDVL